MSNEKDGSHINGDTPADSKLPHTPSLADSQETHVIPEKHEHKAPGCGESALPEDKDLEALQNAERDWECDPENARNWPAAQKWLAVSIISLYTFASPLASSMMAPGLPDVAIKYGITDSTTIALTLCVFLLSFAIAVSWLDLLPCLSR